MNSPKDSLLLIDGHAVLYRAFHSTPPLRTKDGVPTNAVYGFITTIFKAIEELSPKYIAVAFDLSGPTFRHKSFAGYKANRKPAPDDLKTQIPYAYKVVEALNIPIFTSEGFEADDVIGTLTTQAKKHNTPVIIATGDKDSFQLVNDNTFVYTMKRTITDTVLYDTEGVKTRMGVAPEQITDYKALAGDASDEIPGVDGIGDKTAVTILQHVSSIEDLYQKLKEAPESIEFVSPRIKQKLIDSEAIAKQSKELATIDCDAPVTLALDKCLVHDYDAQKVTEVFQDLEFFSLLKRLPKEIAPDTGIEVEAVKQLPRDWEYTILTNSDQIEKVVSTLRKREWVCVDTETNNLHGELVGVSLSGDGKHGYYVPFLSEHGAECSPETLIALLKPLLEDTNVKKVGHNIKYDLAVLRRAGTNVVPIAFDTMIAAYVLHAHYRTFDFDTVAARELGYTTIPLADIVPSKKDIDFRQIDGAKLAEYAAEDAVITYRLFEHFAKALKKEPKLSFVAETLDFPLVRVLEIMEERGVCLDTKALDSLSADLEKEIDTVRKEIEQYAKEPININSPAQLQKLLFDDLGLSRQGIKTTQGGLSTAASELEKLQGQHPVIDAIMKYREMTKLQSTYVQTLPKLVDESGRIHTEFNQVTAATGRLSSNNPNLQNIPIRSELGNKIRTAFRAPTGYQLISLDYSQFELRIIAHLAEDDQLQQVFLDGRDIHDEVAKRLKIDRRAAKAINFGIIYGLSAFGLSQGLKIDPKVAKEYIDAYFAEYPKLAAYLKNTKQEVKDKGYVETLYGRRRELPEINAANAILRAAAERMAINAPAQGTEADLMKLAMIRTQEWLEETYRSLPADKRPYLVLQVHDSLLLECPEDLVKEVSSNVKKIMEEVESLSVPLTVDCSTGNNWGELEKVAAD